MAVKTYRLGAGYDGICQALFESDQAAATKTSDGWTVAKVAAGNSDDLHAGVKDGSGGMTSETTTPKPTLATLTLPNSNAFKTPSAENGTFANTAWTFTVAVRATTASSQVGRVRLRVFKSVNANATVATELTAATQVGTTSAALSTTADVTSVVTWSPGTTIAVTNEFLFFAIAWEITTAGGNNSADVLLRTGQAAGGTFFVTPDLSAGTAAIVPDVGMALTVT